MPGTEPAISRPDTAPARIAGRYTVLATAHATAESTVYRCCERLPEREVAVKCAADGRPVLADFGTARRHGHTVVEDASITLTPAVAAPEVCAGAPGDGRSDLYSLGVLVFTAIAGRYPFDPARARETMEQHRLS